MSRRASFKVGTAVCAWTVAMAAAQAQTIADYSRVQRALLENAMTQAAARSATLPASAPGVAAPALAVRVSGVFATAGSAIAEVAVNDVAYLLVAGEGVPGTAWRVESVALDRVVLARHEAGAGGPEPTRRVFSLSVLR
jgi:hypothetical protein